MMTVRSHHLIIRRHCNNGAMTTGDERISYPNHTLSYMDRNNEVTLMGNNL
jgi:hypothetical protein